MPMGTAPSLLPVGVAKLKDITLHYFGKGLNYKVHWHTFQEVILALSVEPLCEDLNAVIRINV
jgi:hypothetical protein